MNLYKIVEFTDGGPNDRGIILMYAEALSKEEAKLKYAKHINDSSIMNHGFITALETGKQEYLNRYSMHVSRKQTFKILK